MFILICLCLFMLLRYVRFLMTARMICVVMFSFATCCCVLLCLLCICVVLLCFVMFCYIFLVWCVVLCVVIFCYALLCLAVRFRRCV